MEQVCSCCASIFTPLPTVKRQQYCGKPDCQRTRKRRWQKRKRDTDDAYRENQADCRKAWGAKHPEYWKTYRANHPAYVEQNRKKQRERNRRRVRKRPIAKPDMIANMDESTLRKTIPFGQYRLTPVGNGMIANMDEWIVEIGVISMASGMVLGGP